MYISLGTLKLIHAIVMIGAISAVAVLTTNDKYRDSNNNLPTGIAITLFAVALILRVIITAQME